MTTRQLPSEDADELTHLRFRQHNLLSRRQALRFFTESAIRHRLTTGRWQQIHRAVYLVLPVEALTAPQRRWAAVLGAPPGAVTAGLTALAQHGLRGFDHGPVHLLLPAPGRDRDLPAEVVLHRTRHLPRTDVHRVGAPPSTMPGRSLVDAAQWAVSDDLARAVIAAGFQQRLVSEDEIAEVLSRLPRVQRRRLIARACADAAGGAHSLPEMQFLRLCRRAGFPTPQLQVRRRDRAGRRRYLDAYFPDHHVHVEIDGGQHLDPRRWWDDQRRQNEVWIAGDRVLRFPTWVVRERTDEVVSQLREALASERGH